MRQIARTVGIALVGAGLGLTPIALAEKVQSIAALKPAAGGERRVALVIGNSAYKSAPLRNPVRDARAMAKALSETGFAVTMIEDASQAGMRRAIRAFGDELARGGVGLFFYAGHGMQIRGKNYLIPVNADIEREDEVEDQAVDANLVLSKMDSAKNSLNVMILDACRNNPFQRSFRSAQQGLAQMDAPSGTLISFATAPGSVASDGDGENGLYTKHLLAAIRQPGLPIEQLFKQVRIGVTKETGDKQIPWESSSLKGDFYFLPPDPNAGAAVQKAAIDKAVTDAVRQAEEKAARERSDLQSQMQQMKALIEQMLAKQKAEFEEELRKRGAAQAQTASADAARQKAELEAKQKAERETLAKAEQRPAPPVQVASVAPAQAVIQGARLAMPKAGDRWVYRSWVSTAPEKKSEATQEVKAVLGDSVLETATAPDGNTSEWVFGPGAYLVGFGHRPGPGAYNFSPYLLGFHDVKPGDSWQKLPFQRLGNCSEAFDWNCTFDAKVAGAEKVTVAAGTFDALRIEIDQVVLGPRWSAARKATYWFSPQVKRVVKATWKFVQGQWGGPDVEAELVSYKLN
jgi:uncharacterized caspase-like protein